MIGAAAPALVEVDERVALASRRRLERRFAAASVAHDPRVARDVEEDHALERVRVLGEEQLERDVGHLRVGETGHERAGVDERDGAFLDRDANHGTRDRLRG